MKTLIITYKQIRGNDTLTFIYKHLEDDDG